MKSQSPDTTYRECTILLPSGRFGDWRSRLLTGEQLVPGRLVSDSPIHAITREKVCRRTCFAALTVLRRRYSYIPDRTRSFGHCDARPVQLAAGSGLIVFNGIVFNHFIPCESVKRLRVDSRVFASGLGVDEDPVISSGRKVSDDRGLDRDCSEG